MANHVEAASMTNATMLVDGVLWKQAHFCVPLEIQAIVERYQDSLVGLAQALIASGRQEEEVIAILRSASDGFSTKLELEIERMSS
jgi:hypothetical protein